MHWLYLLGSIACLGLAMHRAMPTIEGNMRKFMAGDYKNMTNIVRKPASWGD